jgi:lantibiotic modifying enzyme
MNANPAFLETADRIGARLCRDAIWAGGRCNWIGGYGDDPSDIVHTALKPTLYDGTSGIALFLLRLFELTGEKIFRITAEGALSQALSQLDNLRAAGQIGFHDGLAGIAYVASRDDIARELEPDASRLDIINGSAGVIPALLALHRQHGGDALLELAVRHGRSLVDRAHRSDAGWSWKTVERQHRDLTGFAHGASGIACALLELFQITCDETFRCAAVEGFRYESSCYDPSEGNWPDFRVFPDASVEKFICPLQWCHGAPGIGLSRLRAFQILGDDLYRNEAVTAIRTTLKSFHDLDEGNYSLCHGHAGNAELLVYAGQVLQNPEYAALAARVGEAGIERYENDGVPWPSGVPGNAETPDLMLGLAGTGYFYLRLYDPIAIPPILIVKPEFAA